MTLNLYGQPIALYGKLQTRPRAEFIAAIEARGGTITRDLTRRSQMLVVGHGAVSAIADGRLQTRLFEAMMRELPFCGEAVFWETLHGIEPDPPTYPIARIGADIGDEDLLLLYVFDLIRVGEEHTCRFADVETIRSAGRLAAAGQPIEQIIATLLKAGKAPRGRRKVVPGPAGEAVLEWDDGLTTTTLDGQGLLPILAEAVPSADDLFELAMEAEEAGDAAEAERLYAACMRADRKDPIAPFNLGNLMSVRGALDEAILHYRLAIARDPDLVEAYYNLASALEAKGDMAGAEAALDHAILIDEVYADALFNLAQLKLKRDDLDAARALFELYLATDPPRDWAKKAKRAIKLIDTTRRRAGG